MFPEAVDGLLARLEAAGYQAYAVGGCVRDILRGMEPHDYDVASSARPEQVMALFSPDAVPTGLRHGTVTVHGGNMAIEVTTFRTDGAYLDGRRPDKVCFGTDLREDLRRRDFTMNAMAMDRRGVLYDEYGGQEDLRRGLIRCVGAGDTRFREDALRIMRALRFSAVLGFALEAETADAAVRCAPGLTKVAPERIREEMDRLLCGAWAGAVLGSWQAIWPYLLPEITVGAVQIPGTTEKIWQSMSRAMAQTPANLMIRWTMLLRAAEKLHKGTACRVMRRLHFARRTEERVCALLKEDERPLPRTEADIRRGLADLGENDLRALLAIRRAEQPEERSAIDAAQNLLEWVVRRGDCFTLAQLAVSGHDLIAAGLQGAEIGRAQRQLLCRVINGTLPNERNALLEQLQRERDSEKTTE